VGFVVIVDRRLDKWGSVKSLLLRISVSTLNLCLDALCTRFGDSEF